MPVRAYFLDKEAIIIYNGEGFFGTSYVTKE